ncbi:MAG: peptidoglycan-binding domain-containing protein, partial [Cyanobacteria bacterium J06607_6]
MFHRLLLIALTSIAAGGLGVPASARPAARSRAVLPPAQGDLVAQLDNSDADSPTPAASPAVQSLQNRLGQLGYYEGAADGVFNPATSAALKAFQQNNGLVGTGILDPLTEERLLDRDAVPANIDGAAADAAEPALELPEPTDESTDEPTDELTSPAAESDERSTPPADTDPESIIESAGAEGTEAPSEEVPASDEGETFSLEGAPTEGADGDPDVAAPAETAAPPESEGGLFRLALLGTIIMAVGALGTGLVLWLARQKAQKAAALEEPAPGSQASDDQALNDQTIASSKLSPVPVVKPPAPAPAPQYGQNGQPPAVSETAQLSVNPPPPPLSLSAMPESRV